jgi:hypothetical protein
MITEIFKSKALPVGSPTIDRGMLSAVAARSEQQGRNHRLPTEDGGISREEELPVGGAERRDKWIEKRHILINIINFPPSLGESPLKGGNL